VSSEAIAGYVNDMNTIETSHDPAEQVAIARQQAATAQEPTLPPDEGTGAARRPRWLSGTNLLIGMALGAAVMIGFRFRRRRR
jgi:hypothetical protein